MTYFFKTPKWESQNWDYCYLKTLDIHILLKTNFFGTCKGNILQSTKISFQWCVACFNWRSFDSSLKGFLVGSQILNLIINFSFDYNSCILHLNEQCEGTLGIHTSRSFQCYPRGPIWYLFAFSTKALDI